MADTNFAYQQYDKESMAISRGHNIRVSMKKSVEVAKHIQGKKIGFVKRFLDEVVAQKTPVPYTRFTGELGHKPGKGISSGGYPANVAKAFKMLLLSAEKNAKEKELGEDLYIISASARKGYRAFHAGRYMGTYQKSANLEVVLAVKRVKKNKSQSKVASANAHGGKKE